MRLIVWLWNPWKKYEKTRHNIGFLFLDYLKNEENFEEFRLENKFKGKVSIWKLKWEKVILLKPQTFMNLSWDSVREIVNFYKIEPKEIIIIYDDKDIAFWKIRFRYKWSDWWHNWAKSIIKYFWEKWKRIKIGVWFDKNYKTSDWVLSKFIKKEMESLEDEIFLKTKKELSHNI